MGGLTAVELKEATCAGAGLTAEEEQAPVTAADEEAG